jgi:hypothetical protein
LFSLKEQYCSNVKECQLQLIFFSQSSADCLNCAVA